MYSTWIKYYEIKEKCYTALNVYNVNINFMFKERRDFNLCVSIVPWCITGLWWSPEEPQHCVYHLLLHGINPQDHCFWPSGKTDKTATNMQHLHTYSLSRLTQSICFRVSSYYSFIKRFILVDRSRACSSCPQKTQRVPFHPGVTLSASLQPVSMVTTPPFARGVSLPTTWL